MQQGNKGSLKDTKNKNKKEKSEREWKEQNLLAEITKHEEYEKKKEIKWFVCRGAPSISEEEIHGK